MNRDFELIYETSEGSQIFSRSTAYLEWDGDFCEGGNPGPDPGGLSCPCNNETWDGNCDGDGGNPGVRPIESDGDYGVPPV